MTDSDWGDLESLPPPKDGAPKWLWFCGCGCLFFVLLFFAFGTWSYRFVKQARDPELQWPALAELLPHDQRAEGFELLFGMDLFDFEIYVLQQAEGDVIACFLHLDEHVEGPVVMVELENIEAQSEGTFLFQGRELTWTRYVQSGDAPPIPFPFPGQQVPRRDKEAGDTPVLQIDLTPEGAQNETLALILYRTDAEEPVTLEDARQFLAPFHVGEDR